MDPKSGFHFWVRCSKATKSSIAIGGLAACDASSDADGVVLDPSV